MIRDVGSFYAPSYFPNAHAIHQNKSINSCINSHEILCLKSLKLRLEITSIMILFANSSIVSIGLRFRRFSLPARRSRARSVRVCSFRGLWSELLKLSVRPSPCGGREIRANWMVAIMKLNIGWFAEVLSQTPHDISGSRYYASVTNVHKQSFELLRITQELANAEFEMLTRWGLFWSNAFSAAVRSFISSMKCWTDKRIVVV
jgi:hypothetical protein